MVYNKGYRGHVGTGRGLEVSIGVRAKDAVSALTVSALNIYKHMPAVKKHRNKLNFRKYSFKTKINKNIFQPNIRLATPNEAEHLCQKRFGSFA